MNIRTDLAMEAREILQKKDPESVSGVSESHETLAKGELTVTRVRIETEEGARKMGKAVGTYVTLEFPAVPERSMELEDEIANQLAKELKALLPEMTAETTALVVGLGNWNMTPDALGPRVVDQMLVTRHMLMAMPDAIDERIRSVSAIAPGVLGLTGLETFEVISSLVERIAPDVLVVIDSLAARKASRIGTTIQISDTGIQPGSGVGNRRREISQKTLGIPVIALGVPMVVYASTIAQDAIEMALSGGKRSLNSLEEKLLENVQQQVLSGTFPQMVVTPKEVDELIEEASKSLSEGLNMAFHDGLSLEEVRSYGV
ncbi:GPR endopeptidase [Gehongia tenuis]|uniref:Germination protease n=1 Tax=Gehongia tenuis TaxID=2763655 RepID=A0A926D463_9FIRM|nr:GPR endopeptidase [Gehongia tenuis]MBC8531013.1 GPR endopeptidase [Gehongia tenuis]